MASDAGAAAEDQSAKRQKLSKRQRRKQPNEKNKWPQHPKIQDHEVRSKAYIRVAGLGSTTKKEEAVDPKLDLLSPEVKFGRLLGGTDQRKRHAAVRKLKAYLKARCDINNEDGGLSEMDLLKLWKGLWYTLYMADKIPVQAELSKHLAELIWCVAGTEEEDEYAGQAYMDMCDDEESNQSDEDEVELEEIVNTLKEEHGFAEGGSDDSPSDADTNEDGSDEGDEDEEEKETAEDDPEDLEGLDEDDMEETDESEIHHCRGAHLASLLIRTFFRTIQREWGNMDKYRVDKFYTLVRLYMHEIFKYMASRHWNLGIIRLFNDAMFEEVLNRRPNGLRYHLIDVALEELAKVNSKAPMELTEATFLDTLEPYFAMCQTGAGDDSVQARVMEQVIDKFLEEYSVVSDKAVKENEEAEGAESLVFNQVHVGSVAQFIFELASDPETRNQYRKSLYDVHKKYMRQLKNVGTDVELNDEEEAEAEQGEGLAPALEDEQDMVEAQEENLQSNEGTQQMVVEDGFEGKMDTSTPKGDEKQKEKKKKSKRKLQSSVSESASGASKKKRKNQEETKQRSAPDALEGAAESKKKKKQKKDVTPDKPAAASSSQDEDEVVTISISEQKKATNQAKKKKKTAAVKPSSEATSSPEGDDKRVKWQPSNRAKSYKASMKALATADLPDTTQQTPEKSILLNKGKKKKGKLSKKAARKKAANYF